MDLDTRHFGSASNEALFFFVIVSKLAQRRVGFAQAAAQGLFLTPWRVTPGGQMSNA